MSITDLGGDDQCPHCPTDVDYTGPGYAHCVECGWTEDPSALPTALREIDRLRAAQRPRCTCDYAGMEGESHKPWCEIEGGPHVECRMRIEALETLGDALADAAAEILQSESGDVMPPSLYVPLSDTEKAWRAR